ncbi:MAG: hypothetical protein IPK81_03330 [Rhodospirillales bacterium]|nr:MAG: hypothetical protein IPK81_03330 [Rhodospirillales bacterium]
MASHEAMTSARSRTVAAALVAGGALGGVGVPAFLLSSGTRTVELAPGVDALVVCGAAIFIVDAVLAWYFWRRARAIAATEPPSDDGPVTRG